MNSNSLVSAMDKLFVIPYRRKLFEVMNEKQITRRCHCKSTVSFNVQDVTRTLPLWDGPLEKWCVAAGGKWDFFSFQGFFFTSIASAEYFFGVEYPAWMFFWVERGGLRYSTVAILILTLATVWLPGAGFKQLFFYLSHRGRSVNIKLRMKYNQVLGT